MAAVGDILLDHNGAIVFAHLNTAIFKYCFDSL